MPHNYGGSQDAGTSLKINIANGKYNSKAVMTVQEILEVRIINASIKSSLNGTQSTKTFSFSNEIMTF